MNFRPPQPVSGGWNTDHWTAWLASLGVVHSVRSVEPQSCDLCNAPSILDQLGRPYPRCTYCDRSFRTHLRRIVPISYSTPQGLTSLIAQAKEDIDRQWVQVALASLLYTFLRDHWGCLEVAADGPIDMVVPIPSHPSSRGGRDHLASIHSIIPIWSPPRWDLNTLIKVGTSSASDRPREAVPDLFAVAPGRSVVDKRVLLIDDLCTTGNTPAAAGATLMAHGALKPLAVTIGRHVRTGDPHSAALLQQLPSRGWVPGDCAVHIARGP
jgi:predicted amidophosphoribosyltransferase